MPDLVAWMLGERKGSILEPCKACANGTCTAMEEAARADQGAQAHGGGIAEDVDDELLRQIEQVEAAMGRRKTASG